MTKLDAVDYLEPLLPGLVPVPAIQPGICPVCRTAVEEPYDDCRDCRGHSVSLLPISLSVNTEMLHTHLRKYKDGQEDVRPQLTLRLAALVEVFLRHHLDPCLGGPVDGVATVPSVRRDAPTAIVARLGRFNGMVNPLRRDPSTGQLEIVRPVHGARILLLDDTFTQGNAIFGAMRALQHAGAIVVGPVAIGRHLNPSYGPSGQLLDRLRSVPWDPTACARCAGVIVAPPLRSPAPPLF